MYMDIAGIGLLMLSATLWLMAVCIHFATISSSRLSKFEIIRRADNGDREAKKLLHKQQLLPKFNALRSILSTLIAAIAIVATISLLGPFAGGLISLAVALLSPAIVKVGFLRRLFQGIWQLIEPKVWQWTESLSLLKWFAYQPQKHSSEIASKEELIEVIGSSHDEVDRRLVKRLQSVIEFENTSIADVMTPFKEVVTVDENEVLGPLVLDELHRTKQRHYPVVKSNSEEVVGILFVDESIELSTAHNTVKEAMDQSVYYISQDKDLNSALKGFLQTARHLFIVLDEHNETVGVVQLTDAIAALIGEDSRVESDRPILLKGKSSK